MVLREVWVIEVLEAADADVEAGFVEVVVVVFSSNTNTDGRSNPNRRICRIPVTMSILMT